MGSDAESVRLRNAEGDVTQDNPLEVVDPTALDIRFDPTDVTPIYIGMEFDNYDASTSTTTWTVLKQTFSGINVTRIQRRTDIAWTDRATSF